MPPLALSLHCPELFEGWKGAHATHASMLSTLHTQVLPGKNIANASEYGNATLKGWRALREPTKLPC
jgi:hypothetical protein